MMKRILVLSAVCVMIQMAHAEVAVTGYEFAHGKAVVSGMAGITNTPPPDALYRDPRQPIDKRVEDLIGNRGTDPCDTVGVIRLMEIGVARGCD